MSTGRPHHYGHLLQVYKESLQPLTLYTSFHDLINVNSSTSGADNPRGQNFDVNRNLLSLQSLATSFKKISLKSDFIHLMQVLKKYLWSLILYNLFYDLIHVYSPGPEADSPQGTKFGCQQKGIITLPICCKFQRNLFEVWFYTFFFHDLIHVYSPRAGAYSPQGTKFWCQQKLLVTSVICC